MPAPDKTSPKAPTVPFTGYQKFVAGLLAFLQFAVILDFMVMSPLGAVIMPSLGISPAKFGIVVSAYAFSAGLSGLLAAGFADRFDRKKLLLFFYVGFLCGTLWCGLARSFEAMLAARIVTGRAEQGSPARARVEDRHGQAHYVMVEPNNPAESFAEGEAILIVRREGNIFRAISRGDHRLPYLGA